MKKLINLKIDTLERQIFEGEVESITIPGESGEITILPGHIPLIASLGVGRLAVQKGQEEIHMALYGGFIQVAPNSKVIILADAAARAEELNKTDILEQKKKLEETLEKTDKDSDKYDDLAKKLEIELNKLTVVDKIKSKE